MLALQGDVGEHLRVLREVGAEPVAVRRSAELDAVSGLVLPGGESTTMAKLARRFGLFDALRERIAAGMPTFGTCAGMILLAERVLDGTADQETFGGLDVTVRRNAFGRQVHSFEGEVGFDVPDAPPGTFDAPVHATFIRAPWVEEAGEGVRVLARVGAGEAAGRIVAVRQGPLLATSFHPEVAPAGRRGGAVDVRLHRYFADQVVASNEGNG